MTHTPEPQTHGGRVFRTVEADGRTIVATDPRIVACVNACAGIDDPVATIAEARKILDEIDAREYQAGSETIIGFAGRLRAVLAKLGG